MASPMVHYHIEIRGKHFGCYNVSGPETIAIEAMRLGGTMVTVPDADCPNGRKPETIAHKQRMAHVYAAQEAAYAATWCDACRAGHHAACTGDCRCPCGPPD